eukprot:scaffold6385_cov51-Isochrysis_galbana.AAC.1
MLGRYASRRRARRMHCMESAQHWEGDGPEPFFGRDQRVGATKIGALEGDGTWGVGWGSGDCVWGGLGKRGGNRGRGTFVCVCVRVGVAPGGWVWEGTRRLGGGGVGKGYAI